MKTPRVGLFLLLTFLPLTQVWPQAPAPPVVTSRLVPKSVYAESPSQLIVTVKGSSLAGLTVRFRASRGFHVTPVEMSWSGTADNTVVVCLADVTTSGTETGQITGAIMTSALLKNEQVASDILEFEYQPGLRVCIYLLVGLTGVAIGYAVRMLVLALKAVQPQVEAQTLAAEESPKGLRKFVLEHYWTVDFAVTLVLGFLALVALMKDGRPPATATYWHHAAMLGVGLGLLTNSDLLTRVQPK